MGRKPKNAVANATATKTKSKKRDNDTLADLAEIESKLLKKAKVNGNVIEQGEIYDALNNYELEDDVIDDLIEYFAKQKIEVINEEEEDEDLDDEDEDIGNLSEEEMLSEPDDTDDFYVETSDESEEDFDFDIDHLDSSLIGEAKVNDSVKMYLKEIGKYELLKPEEEPILAAKILEGDEEAKQRLINANLR